MSKNRFFWLCLVATLLSVLGVWSCDDDDSGGSSLSREGESCGKTGDCESGLRCIGQVCVPEGSGDVDGDTDTDGDADTDSDTDVVLGCVLDENTNLCWQEPKASPSEGYYFYQWQDAIEYCYALVLGGHDDWRLPTSQDFFNLLGGCDTSGTEGARCNSCRASAACTALFGPDFDVYWADDGEATGGYRENAWYVSFDEGYAAPNPGGLYEYVRCVRPGP